MFSDCRMIRLTSHRIRRSRPTIRRSRRTNRHVSHRSHRSHRRSHPSRRHRHHWSHPCHHRRRYRCRRFRSCRRLTSRQCFDRRFASRCWFRTCLRCLKCLTCRRQRLTSQNVPTRSFHSSARRRRSFLPNASRRTRPDRPCYHETRSHLPGFRMSRPMTRPAIPTCSAFPSRDPTRRRSTRDFGFCPPWVYPPAYFDCDLHRAADYSAALWAAQWWQRMCQGVM